MKNIKTYKYKLLEKRDRVSKLEASLDKNAEREVSEVEDLDLAAIDEALGRIEEGIYGDCLACGEKISDKRLAVLPEASFCIKCQSSDELSHKLPPRVAT